MDALIEQINSAGKSFVEFAWPMLWQSGVLIAILLVVDFVLRKRVRAVFRYWLWMLVFIKLVLPTTVSSPVSIGRFVGEPIAAISITQKNQPEGGDISNNIQNTLPAAIGQAGPPPASPVQSQTIRPEASLIWQGGILLVWLMVVCAMLLLLLQRAVFVCGLVRQSAEVNGVMNDTLRFCRKLMGVRRTIGLKVSPNATSPAVCGLFRPVILLPRGLGSSVGISSVRMVLMHELAHIGRGDLWVNLAQTLLQIVYFYNPLLWLANWVIRRVREQAVDEAVQVALGEKAPQYPETLLSVAKLAFERPALSLRLVGVVESKSALAGRIKRMLTRPIPRTAKLGIIGSFAVVLFAVVLLPMAKAEKSVESIAAQADSDSAATLSNGKIEGLLPNIYIMGSGSAFEKITSVVRDWTANKTGRNHDKKSYDQIFIDGIWGRKDGDLIVLVFSLDDSGRIPSEYADLLPEPWSKIEASLKQGNTVELAGKSRGMNVIVLAAPKMDQIGEVIAGSKNLHNPKQYVGSFGKGSDPGIEDFNIQPYPEGGLYTVRVSIRNKGRAESPEFRVYFYRNDPDHLKPMTHGAGPIKPGDVWNEGSMPFALKEGTNEIAVVLDPANLISESNEMNNQALMTVVVKDGKIVEKKVSISSAKVEKSEEADLLRVYQVNRTVAEFPEKEDFSRPESSYAAINRMSAGEDSNGWLRVSAKELADKLAGGSERGKNKVEPEWGKVLLNAKILEVRICDNNVATVIAELPHEFSTKPIRKPIDVRHLKFEDGKWLNTGNDRVWTIEEARKMFDNLCKDKVGAPGEW